MGAVNLIDSFSEFKELKNIDRPTLMSVLEESFRSVLLKRFGPDAIFDVIVNPDKGDVAIYRNRIVVEDDAFENSVTQIPLSEAVKIDEDYEVGEEVVEQVRFEEFGRRSILAVQQNLKSRILEVDNQQLYNKYKDRVGEIITAEVHQLWKKEILLLDEEQNELILPKTEQIPSDYFKKSENVRAVISQVELRNGAPQIILSRTSPLFLERLFEREIPEILDGLITIKKVVRVPGERAKVAVESYDDRIDPVGACVGMKGSRIHGIVRELRNESIDVIPFSTNIPLYISRALNPAKINNIVLDEEHHHANVYLDPDQVSLAIGKSGLNIKLASQLTGYELDVYREVSVAEEDVKIESFSGKIEDWIIDELKRVGLDTAESVLELSEEELETRTDLEIETIRDVQKIIKDETES